MATSTATTVTLPVDPISSEATITQSDVKHGFNLDPDSFDDELIPFNACCCYIQSCFFKMPDCFGAKGDSTLICCRNEWSCCKPGRHQKEHLLNDGTCSLISPDWGCRGACHWFCLDSRHSFIDCGAGHIMDPKFPCLCTIVGFTVAYNWMWTPMCLRPWSSIKDTKGALILGEKKPPASSQTDAAVAAPATAATTTGPVNNPNTAVASASNEPSHVNNPIVPMISDNSATTVTSTTTPHTAPVTTPLSGTATSNVAAAVPTSPLSSSNQQ